MGLLPSVFKILILLEPYQLINIETNKIKSNPNDSIFIILIFLIKN
jgi:hypothetical protein